ncbi:MAG TPA: FtsX-like permease family protein, partial [Blastocatellia bacterium]
PAGQPITQEERGLLPAADSAKAKTGGATPDYFRAMGVPLLRGRFFAESDGQEAPLVVIVNETMARRYWPSESPLGKRFKRVMPGMEGEWITVIGVVGDTTPNRDGRIYPLYYRTIRQWTWGNERMVVRTETPPLELVAVVRRVVRSVDSRVPDFEITTVEQALAKLDRPRTFQTQLIGAFAVSSLLLSALGLYGLMSYLVAQRAKEIGIRVALGAQRREVLKLVIRQGMAVALPGVLLGLGAALALTRLIKSLLFGVSATDPLTFIGIALLLLFVAFAACVIPAWRATKVDPLVALRCD